jgi:hypothetical protein
MFTIELKYQGHHIASIPIDESTLRELAYATGPCTRTAGADADSYLGDGYSVQLHRNPGADALELSIRERGEVKATMRVSSEGVRDLLDAEHSTYFLVSVRQRCA